MDYVPVIITLIVFAFLPWLLFFIYYSKLKGEHPKLFVIAGAGWLVALVLRFPILYGASFILDLLMYYVMSAILAGVFEEGFRYILAKKLTLDERTNGEILSFGIGWGVFEVWIVHTLSLATLLMLILMNISFPGMTRIPPPEQLFISGMASVIERWIAVSFHIIATLVITKALLNKNYLWIAIILHSVLDLIAVLSGFIGLNIWLIELNLLVTVVLIYILVHVGFKLNVIALFTKLETSFKEAQ
ncbi:MAG: YhfC family intramembrane metalloprotease [Candidatus Odinarchaeota archaeon]|nr:YhfC family intramembrane metalloprotease [Candidatus Odinarchaeota archaeon]